MLLYSQTKGNNKSVKEVDRMISFLGACAGAALIGAIVYAISSIWAYKNAIDKEGAIVNDQLLHSWSRTVRNRNSSFDLRYAFISCETGRLMIFWLSLDNIFRNHQSIRTPGCLGTWTWKKFLHIRKKDEICKDIARVGMLLYRHSKEQMKYTWKRGG